MTDPAVEAAQRAWDTLPERSYATRQQIMEAAALEMAKSVQELHKPAPYALSNPDPRPFCWECDDDWPCETAKRVYPSEELGL
ncbi:hypothetical protein AN911_00125 [Mycobacteroides immunogenum]|jgi:hypothetical protein|uniref:Uncharacterized protein n=1 Tax=Mycobacteroides immunogenum TaxID=83262 RepID=A0A7V8LQR2_9MYCO|nr:hypothetical protein AN909_05805 [Mycobacteroides immunogenum]KPG14252.1 hypothetical protein AN908_06590 [Mycobacteroides immunogenum]KPG17470.1 hypothetical protein AN910_05030 [Mycobacteroides immunogenum]KPG23945.1 hypothetical protein AN911_00125 [Mycobacteroides immunogenum]KPG38985.1 hypothetical protein AN914_09675 [Mycobacteroides immunogenum]